MHLEKSGSFGYVLTIDFLYTNNSDDARNFINDPEVYVRTFQDGIELDSPGYTSENGVFDTNDSYTNIKQGATLATQLAFIVPNPSEPVEMEIGPWGQSDKIITKEINFIKE